jgi:uncharacterized protein
VIAIVPPEPADVASPCASPCTGVCAIGEDGLCDGCARTLDEIAGWSAASLAERRAILAVLPGRREARRAG